MDALGWVVLVGVFGYPLLFAYAYRELRRGSRSRESFHRGGSIGGIGFAVLLQNAAQRWLATPADDVVAVASLAVLVPSIYLLYRSYARDGSNADAPAQN